MLPAEAEVIMELLRAHLTTRAEVLLLEDLTTKPHMLSTRMVVDLQVSARLLLLTLVLSSMADIRILKKRSIGRSTKGRVSRVDSIPQQEGKQNS